MAGLTCDAIVLGGGFFGCEIALELRRIGFERVILFEREPDLLRRASSLNQARVHHGYHYPRSYGTAIRSRRNFLRFAEDYRDAIVDSFVKLYAIARGSRVSASQFAAFCDAIGAPCRPAPPRYRHLFDRDLIEDSFVAQEFAFDSVRLAERLRRALSDAGIDVRTGAECRLVGHDSSSVSVEGGGKRETGAWLFNCTYAELDLAGIPLRSRIKKELAEILLIEPSLTLANLGVTVMDGPYFSSMPFPTAPGVHTLSHVRYTPHHASEEAGHRPFPPARSNGDYMMRDAARYMPHLGGARILGSIFEVKAVLARAEQDDARPILIERCAENPHIYSILGAKIDNIYDAKDYLSQQSWA